MSPFLTPLAGLVLCVIVLVLLLALFAVVQRLERGTPDDAEHEIEARACGVKVYYRVGPGTPPAPESPPRRKG